MSLNNSSNGCIKSAYSISVGGMANCKLLDKRDSSFLVSLYLEKLKITIFGSWPTFDGNGKTYRFWLEKYYRHGYNQTNLYLTTVRLYWL